jgi:hypothetical protein
MSPDTVVGVGVSLLIWVSGGVLWIVVKTTRIETLLKAHTEDGRVHNFGRNP